MVEAFRKDEALRQDIVTFLRGTHDSQRIVQKLSLGRGDADDLVALARTIEATGSIVQRLDKCPGSEFDSIVGKLVVPTELAATILDSIDEEGLRRQQQEVAEVASALGEPSATVSPSPADADADTEDGSDSGFLGEVMEIGGSRRPSRSRRERINRGLRDTMARGLSDSGADDTWIMKKTYVPYHCHHHHRHHHHPHPHHHHHHHHHPY